jgi:hypothetical protein
MHSSINALYRISSSNTVAHIAIGVGMAALLRNNAVTIAAEVEIRD